MQESWPGRRVRPQHAGLGLGGSLTDDPAALRSPLEVPGYGVAVVVELLDDIEDGRTVVHVTGDYLNW